MISIGTTYEGRDFDYLKAILPFVKFIEVSPDSLAFRQHGATAIRPAALAELVWAQQHTDVDLLVHGVSLSIGSFDGYSEIYIGLLEQLFEQCSIKWHSEHLAYTMVNGEPLGTMLTLPRTDESVDIVCRRVDAIQKKFRVPFLLENVINLLPQPDCSYSPAAFLNRIAGLTGCGLVLDIYNMQCDEYNWSFNIPEFLDELNLDNVYELHLAGGQTEPEYDFMMDIHSGLTATSTLTLAKQVIDTNPKNLQAVTFEILEEFIERVSPKNIIAELQRFNQIFNNLYEPANASN